jgi:predicted GNAT family N-acyltransferase
MKPQLTKVKISQVAWSEAENYLREVRTTVFIEEQLVTPEFEWDELDEGAVHLLAMLEDVNSAPRPIACLRIINFHKIGRMAVLKNYRNMGLGTALLLEAVEICKNHGSKSICLSAQMHAIHFYQQAGFKQVSDEYCDVHIPHVDMQLDLN